MNLTMDIPVGVVNLSLLSIFVIILVKVVQLIRQRLQMEKSLSGFPTAPDRHWFWGHLPKMTADEAAAKWILDAMIPLKYYMCLWFGPFQSSITLHHPDTLRPVITSSEPKEQYAYDMIRPWLGDGLLLSGGKKWARNRRLLSPGFHFEVLRPYAKIFQDSANALVDKWRASCGSNTSVSREMFADVSLFTLDSLLKCIFSVESNCQVGDTRHPYICGVVELSNLAMLRFRFLPYHINLVYHMSYSGYRWRSACNTVHTYTRSVIDERKKALISANEPTRKYIDFLDILLRARDEDGSGLTDQEIQDEVDTFMFEGHDTTASGISWMLYNMALYPVFQQKCRDEIDALIESKGSEELEWDDLSHLPYTTQCIKESLRLFPPVPMVMRRLTRDIAFPDDKGVAPAGTFITVAISAMHHNPAVWKDPETYDPERFSMENAKNIPPYAFVPFSAGPRNCIGQQFAMNEMKVAVATILRNFNLSVDESVHVEALRSVITRAKNGIQLFIQPRKR